MPFSNRMPSAKQKWAHSICSKKLLRNALNSSSITAIEADIVMGYKAINEDSPPHQEYSKTNKVPIMAHPPLRHSDLKMEEFLIMATYTHKKKDDKEVVRKVKKHIKLDFKEIATVKPTIDAINDLGILLESQNTEVNIENEKSIFLNADIFPGPGMRSDGARIDADSFLSACLNNMQSKNNNEIDRKYIFSLGWTTDPRSYGGYTDMDIDMMMKIIKKHNLASSCAGIVFAVNARVLVQDFKPLIRLLWSIESSQLLVWTATGEPPISRWKIRMIADRFNNEGVIDRIGFDCKVASSSFSGFLYDFLVTVSSIYFYARKWISSK